MTLCVRIAKNHIKGFDALLCLIFIAAVILMRKLIHTRMLVSKACCLTLVRRELMFKNCSPVRFEPSLTNPISSMCVVDEGNCLVTPAPGCCQGRLAHCVCAFHCPLNLFVLCFDNSAHHTSKTSLLGSPATQGQLLLSKLCDAGLLAKQHTHTHQT